MKTTKEQIDLCLKHFEEGLYGTPEQPILNRTGNNNFWNCYFGKFKPSRFRGTNAYPKAKAGELAAKKNR